MKLEHVAINTLQPQVILDFYTTHFGAKVETWVSEEVPGLTLYFLNFGDGCRLEVETLTEGTHGSPSAKERIGIAHLAFLCTSKEELIAKTKALEEAGVTVTLQPTDYEGDFFESACLDPDGNLVELTVGKEYL